MGPQTPVTQPSGPRWRRPSPIFRPRPASPPWRPLARGGRPGTFHRRPRVNSPEIADPKVDWQWSMRHAAVPLLALVDLPYVVLLVLPGSSHLPAHRTIGYGVVRNMALYPAGAKSKLLYPRGGCALHSGLARRATPTLQRCPSRPALSAPRTLTCNDRGMDSLTWPAPGEPLNAPCPRSDADSPPAAV